MKKGWLVVALALGLGACGDEPSPGTDTGELAGPVEDAEAWASLYCERRWRECVVAETQNTDAEVHSCTSIAMFSAGCKATSGGYDCSGLTTKGYDECLAEIEAVSCETMTAPGQESTWALPPCSPFE